MGQIDDLRKKLEKRFKDSTEIFPDFTSIKQIDVIPSSSAIIDAVTGIGGFPRGRVTEIYGGYSTGKTTLATQASAVIQTIGPDQVVLFMDYEHAFDAAYAHKLGVNLDPNRFIFCQPDSFEQGDLIMDSFVSSGLVDLIVVDSAAAMTPAEDLEGKVDSTGRIGLQAQLMSRMLTRMTKKISKGRKPALVILNQTRTKIDIKNTRNTGEDSAAGNALRFYASLRLKLENISGEGEEGRSTKDVTDRLYTRNKVRVTAVKNKLAPPFIRGTFFIDYGRGVNNIVSIAELAEQKLGIMSGAGFFKYAGDKEETSFSCRGRDEFHRILAERPVLMKEIEGKVLAAMREEQAMSLGVTVIDTTQQAKEIESDGHSYVDLSSGSADGLPIEEL